MCSPRVSLTISLPAEVEGSAYGLNRQPCCGSIYKGISCWVVVSRRLHRDCGKNAMLRFCKMEALAGYDSRLILPGTQGLKQLAKLVEKKPNLPQAKEGLLCS